MDTPQRTSECTKTPKQTTGRNTMNDKRRGRAVTSYHTIVKSPLGPILLTADEDGLTGVNFQDAKGAKKPRHGSVESKAPFREAERQIGAYFRGVLRNFNLALSVKGTAFQRSVWKALCDIPYGETISYRELARRIGRPTACRAVGAANARNPLPIVVPCHRVVGSNGQLTGYYGGTYLKEYLLSLEAAGN
jgi:methylated-DNA-[protein]-cysteine S-methyltransferase